MNFARPNFLHTSTCNRDQIVLLPAEWTHTRFIHYSNDNKTTVCRNGPKPICRYIWADNMGLYESTATMVLRVMYYVFVLRIIICWNRMSVNYIQSAYE